MHQHGGKRVPVTQVLHPTVNTSDDHGGVHRCRHSGNVTVGTCVCLCASADPNRAAQTTTTPYADLLRGGNYDYDVIDDNKDEDGEV